MEIGEFFFVFILLGLAIIMGIIYLFKLNKAKKHMRLAEEAKHSGQHREAITHFKEALNYANEKPDMETAIVEQLQALFQMHHLTYDFTDYTKLIEQTRVLKKKSSNKAVKELVNVVKLKKELVKQMPSLS